jgi:glycosyltransferase involved in cell wall biosynthesis
VRIGLLSNPELVNSNYRAYAPLAAVARRGGHEVHRNVSGRPLPPELLQRCDVVHIHRMANAPLRTLVRGLQGAGVGIVWDNDDDVMALPRSNPHYRRLGPAGRRDLIAGTAEMIRLADVVTTPSEVLAERYRQLGAADVRVLENRLPREFMDVKPIAHDGVAIACLAGLEHQADYQQLGLYEILPRLLDAHPDLRVVTIGVGLGLPADRCEHIPLAPFLDLVRILAQADVGLAPLLDTAWNRARSNVKLKEYAAAGLAWLASPIGPYRGMGERQGGWLVPDDGWFDAIERLVVDRRERRMLAKRGTKWVKREAITEHAADWEAALRDAATRARRARR